MGRLYYSASDSASDSTTNGSSITPPEKLQCVYIVASHPFPEVDEFVKTSSAEYGLEVARYVLPMKKGLEIYLEERPSIKAVFVGTRRTDPHGENLKFFDPTDAGWPSFMRIHPVIDWHYGTFSILVSLNRTITNGHANSSNLGCKFTTINCAKQTNITSLSDTWVSSIVRCMTRATQV
jgi:3'-phosphoadenosine 5'-phosphosulfate sulfotransferase (PAPS reductase)/FAD synthetase